jgi:hypothetical protein
MRSKPLKSKRLPRLFEKHSRARGGTALALPILLLLIFAGIPTLHCVDLLSKVRGQTIETPLAVTTYTVNLTDDPGIFINCNQPGAACTLRAAIDAANSHPGDDAIVFNLPAGSVINLSFQLPDISSNIDIIGPGAANLAVARNTGGNYRIFTVTGANTVNFSGLEIRNGVDSGAGSVGGGLKNAGNGTVSVTDCSFVGNSGEGGAIGNLSTGTITITNSRFTNNTSPVFSGGALENVNGTMIVKNTFFEGNRSRHSGGSIENFRGTFAITDSIIKGGGSGGPDNGDGGGAIENHTGLLIVTNTKITNNDSRVGGGVYTSGVGTTNLTGCTIDGNRAGEGGGVMNAGGGTTNLTNSTISNNHTPVFAGGGIQNNDGVVNITNSTILGNSADKSGGGGIENRLTGAINVSNSTIVQNFANGLADSAGHAGGGIENFTTGTVTVKNSIIALNSDTKPAPDVSGIFSSQGFNLIGKKDGSTGFTAGTDQAGTIAVPLDPRIDTLGLSDNGGPTLTVALRCGSPAIDKASRIGLNGPLFSDQRGNFPRLFDDPSTVNASGGDGTDVGAFEQQISCSQASFFQFSSPTYAAPEGAGFISITVLRSGNLTTTASVDFATRDSSAQQRTDYTIAAGTLTFAPGETSKTFPILIVDDVYVEGSEGMILSLSNPVGGLLINPGASAGFTIFENDSAVPAINPLDDARFFVQQHFYDFLSRFPDQGGWDFWTGQITQCGSNPTCIRNKRIDVSNAFFYELEYQQTGAYVFRLYRASFGNNQPTPNPDSSNLTESKKLPAYAVFAADRARVVGGTSLAAGQLSIANAFVLRNAFFAKYSNNLDGPAFVDAILNNLRNDTGVDLTLQRTALINLFNQNGGGNTGRGAVLYRLADDNVQTNPINNRSFIDEEYNRAFVATQYFGYLRRDADIGGFLFWLGQVNSAPLRDVNKQHAMVCSFITSNEYQQRFSSVVTHSNAECP